LRIYETVLPIAPRSYSRILGHRIDELEAALGRSHPGIIENGITKGSVMN
jgi:hypothetical protein